jgi:hypothetical protein
MGKQSLFKFISGLKGCLVLLVVVASVISSLSSVDFNNFNFKNSLEVEGQSTPNSNPANNPNTTPNSNSTSDPYSEQVTKTIRNGTDGTGSTTLKIGTDIRDDSPEAVAEYTRLNQISGTGLTVSSCTQMGGRLGGDNSPAKLEVEDGKGGTKQVDIPVAHSSRRIGICQDGAVGETPMLVGPEGELDSTVPDEPEGAGNFTPSPIE